MNRVDAVVIGAGVVGLAIGRALALRGLETLILEKANAIGTATSARNSEVIHAGIYYPAGSLKARLCLEGREQLYAYARSHEVEHRQCGKLIVATSADQLAALAQIQQKAIGNGVTDLSLLSAAQTLALEPELKVEAALLSPSTGIIDSHGLMRALQADFEAAGGVVVLRTEVERIEAGAVVVGGERLSARVVINAAGLWAPGLAARTEGLSGAPTAHYAKGNYFTLAGRSPFSRLVYPAPEAAGLGIHVTIDLAGQARFGPDVEWVSAVDADALDYRVDAARAPRFEEAIRKYWPGLPAGALQPAYSGVRPKLHGPGHPSDDFIVQGPASHGVAGLVNLFGIESPGLTACLALAQQVLRDALQ